MAPAPELASKDFLKVVDQLWREKRDTYVNTPNQLFIDVNEMFADNKLFLSLHTSEVLPGYLVSARCMVQNTLAPEFFPLSCTVSKGSETEEATGCLRDSFGDDVTNLVDHGNHCSRYCYKMVMVPGAMEWWLDDFNKAQTTATLCSTNCDQMETSSTSAPTKISEFIAKVFDDGTPELKPNTVVDVYGYLSAPAHAGEEGEGQGDSSKHFNVHVLRIKEVCHAPSAESNVSSSIDSPSMRKELINEVSSVLGSTSAAEMFVSFLVSTTYSRPGGTPLCFLPLNIVGVTDSEVAHKIIEMVRLLMPKVRVVTLTPELLSTTRFAPVKNYESDVLHQGELQLSNGTVLIFDETQLPSGSFPVSGFVEENLKVLEELLVEHKMSYDYGFYKIPMDVDHNVLILSKKESRIFKTPFRIPIEPSSSPLSLENVELKREFLQRSRNGVSSVSLTDDVSKRVQDSFVNMCAALDAKADKAALLNEMLILSRLIASSNGSPSVEFEHWQHAIRISSANSSAMSKYSRPGGTPLCFLPLNIVGVTDSEVAHKIIEMVRLLMPKVKVVTLTPELLSTTRFAPVKNYESDVLHQGELQLSNGTVLIFDETQLPSGSFPVSGFVEENLKVLEELLVEHKMSYDYGFYKIPMDVDHNVLILSKKESRIFK
ncbi:hypothetical protein OSTOST_09295, partial [Ostertagia ostertagi]